LKEARTLYRTSLVFAAACLGMLLFGVTLTTLGAVLTPLMDRYRLDQTAAGSLLFWMSQGILVASLVFGPIVDRYGYRHVLIAGTIGVLFGLEAIAFAPSSQLLAVAVFAFGFSGGIINGGTNALVSEISEERRGSGLALLGVFFGLGAFGVPFALGSLRKWFSYDEILVGIGLSVLVPLAMFVAIRFPPPKQPQGFPIAKAGRLARETTLLLLGGMLFFQSGMEITVGGWSARYVHDALGLTEGRSVLVLSFFWLGMMTARLSLTELLRRLPHARVLGVFLAITIAGSVLLLASRSPTAATAGLFLTGFGLASGFPIVLGYIGQIYTELMGTAFSIAFVMALLGGSVLPYLTGVLGDRLGLRASLGIVPAAVLGMALLFLVVLRRFTTHHANLFTKG
jgi:FHS family glucose/mannose:H+ symporter-like MFS transporter